MAGVVLLDAVGMTTLTLKRPVQRATADVKPDPHPRRAAREWLAATFPALFNPADPAPLALGIKRTLLRQRPPAVSYSGVTRALSQWTDGLPYLRAVAAGGPRHGLDGPAGVVTDDEQAHAQATLRKRGAAP